MRKLNGKMKKCYERGNFRRDGSFIKANRKAISKDYYNKKMFKV